MVNNGLRPPVGASFFFYGQHQPKGAKKIDDITDCDWNARIEVYVYATGADPRDKDFSKKGSVYVIISRNGVLNYTVNTTEVTQVEAAFGVTTSLSSTTQLPNKDSKEKDAIAFKFESLLQMLKDQGNTPLSFDAKYGDEYKVDRFEEIYHDAGNTHTTRYESSVVKKKKETFPLHGLSVYQTPDLDPIHFDVALTWGGDKKTVFSVPIDIDLKKELQP